MEISVKWDKYPITEFNHFRLNGTITYKKSDLYYIFVIIMMFKNIFRFSNPKVFFEITSKETSSIPSIEGKIVFELFEDVVPKTALNFKHLCVGDK